MTRKLLGLLKHYYTFFLGTILECHFCQFYSTLSYNDSLYLILRIHVVKKIAF